jgi:2-polyprenyl-3-methyl-5-hydroxy-6-metoxy-1,4-benzoquinol methylase
MNESPGQPQSPLTGGFNVDLVRSYDAAEIIAEWQRTLDLDIAGELKGVTEINLYRCNRSQLEFFHPSNLAGSGKLYEELATRDWYYMPDKWEHGRALESLPAAGRLLEVGCGRGEFLTRAREKGLDVVGVELNQQARMEAERKGFECHDLMLDEAARQWPEGFEVVCAFQVLEHVTEPLQFLRDACTLLKPGGRLLIGVPDGSGWVSRSFNLLDLPPHHMSRWNAASLQFLSTCLPVQMEGIAEEPLAEHHVRSFINTVLMPWPESQQLSRWQTGILKAIVKFLARRLITWNLYQNLAGHSIFAEFVKNPKNE